MHIIIISLYSIIIKVEEMGWTYKNIYMCVKIKQLLSVTVKTNIPLTQYECDQMWVQFISIFVHVVYAWIVGLR